MAQDSISEYGMRKNPGFENATVIDNKSLNNSSRHLDGLIFFMMHVLLTVAYGILWTINLIRERK